jgi:hypothetical protein
MIDQVQLSALTPTQRADLIYRQAQSELSRGLWRAALGDSGERDSQFATVIHSAAKPGTLDSLLAMMTQGGVTALASQAPAAAPMGSPADAPRMIPYETVLETVAAPPNDAGLESQLRAEALGPNARFAGAINRAAERTGFPAGALASILEAEAARGADGTWNIHSRNPRSSAAGLGQFLSGTWESEAEKPGTWLNGEAHKRGWLNAAGQVAAAARGSLLALRYDPEASIQATADYARGNLQQLERSGVRVGNEVASVARVAYLGHHLGPGDAAKFLNGGLDPARARHLLDAQVGSAAAAVRVAQTGNAADAHRQWLTTYVERRIKPERFGKI